mmetsp:Transcript_38405/g.76890  ORF Transcript_38405/g.76890 Transcript_38405/m.76890 type:complete len:227 (-) Transcript_38405:310-990(-)
MQARRGRYGTVSEQQRLCAHVCQLRREGGLEPLGARRTVCVKTRRLGRKATVSLLAQPPPGLVHVRGLRINRSSLMVPHAHVAVTHPPPCDSSAHYMLPPLALFLGLEALLLPRHLLVGRAVLALGKVVDGVVEAAGKPAVVGARVLVLALGMAEQLLIPPALGARHDGLVAGLGPLPHDVLGGRRLELRLLPRPRHVLHQRLRELRRLGRALHVLSQVALEVVEV